jgi:hypothetical protein
VEPPDLWLIFTRRPFNLAAYPAIENHLSKWRKELEPKPENWNDKTQGAWTGRKAGSYQWFEIQDNIAYWQEFEQPKIVVPAIAETPSFAPDFDLHYSNNKSTIFLPEKIYFVLGVLNSSVNAWLATQVCSTKQGGFFDFEPRYSGQLIIPSASVKQINLLEAAVYAVLMTRDARFEQLINGLVFELFFPDDLHRANIHLFDACEKAGIGKLSGLKEQALTTAANELAERIFATSHPIYAMLFDLQALEVVRIIEGKE